MGMPNQLKQPLKVSQKSDSTVNISIHANAKLLPGLHKPQLPVERSIKLVFFIVV